MKSKKLPNIVFIILDSARRDLFGFYGDNRTLTPYLDSLAKKSLVMNDHYASGCGSAQAHVSLFLGQHSSRHGVVHNMSEMKEDVVALPKILKEVGYKTYGHCMASFIPPAGYEDLFGFDEFYYPGKAGTSVRKSFRNILLDRLKKSPVAWNFTKNLYKSIRGQAAITRSSAQSLDGKASLDYLYEKLIDNNDTSPVFAYTTLLHPHTPYSPPQWCIDKVFKDNKVNSKAYDIQANMHAWVNGDMGDAIDGIESMKMLYEAEMLYADSLMKEFVQKLEKNNILKDTILVITSDHGEMLGEHGQLNHGATVWEEIYRLPAIIYSERHFSQGKYYNNISSGLDLYPTLLDMIGKLNYANELTILDGLPLNNDEYSDPNRYLVVDAPPLVLPERLKKYPKLVANGSTFYRAVRDLNFKYIWKSNGEQLLYKVGDYEKPENNIYKSNKSVADEMFKKMTKYYSDIDSAYDIKTYTINMGATAAKKMTNPLIQKELKKLGYM